MKRVFISLLFTLLFAATASAQSAAVIVPSPVPSCDDGEVLAWNVVAGNFVCTSIGAAVQPLSDAFPLIANNADATKLLAFSLTGLTTATTRTWTIPDANITFPTTIASLGANTFAGAQVATSFSGDGSLLTALNATQLTSGTIPLARIVGITNTEIAAAAGIAYSKLTLTGAVVNADVSASAAIDWSKVSKTGSSLADLTTRSATDLTSGTLPDGRFPVTLPIASGVNLTNLDATDLTGTVDTARIAGSYTGITGVGTLTAGAWNATAIGPTYGGTGQTTYATGDLLYATGVNTLGKLAAGANGEFLVLSGGVPVWTASSVAGHDILSATHTDTTVGTVARGDLMTGQGATPTWTKLVKGAANTVLMSDGTDLAWSSNVPLLASGTSGLTFTGGDSTNRFFPTFASQRTISGLTELGALTLGPAAGQGTSGIEWYSDNATAASANSKLNIYVRDGGTQKLLTLDGSTTQARMTWGGEFVIPSATRFYIDGGGDSYVTESSANVVDHYVGGAMNLRQATTHFYPRTDVYIDPLKKLYFDGGGDTNIAEIAANTIGFTVGGSDVARFTSSKMAIGSLTPLSTLHVSAAVANNILRVDNGHATTPYGIYVNFTAANPNNASEYLIYMETSAGLKGAWFSNGGIHNYSANNVNLSDERTKNLTGLAESQREKFAQIKMYRGRYKDTKRTTDDLMWTAQELSAINPDWVEPFQHEERDDAGNITKPMLLGTRDNQVFMANVAVTIEHEALIVGLQQQLAALASRAQKLEATGRQASGIDLVNVPFIGRIH